MPDAPSQFGVQLVNHTLSRPVTEVRVFRNYIRRPPFTVDHIYTTNTSQQADRTYVESLDLVPRKAIATEKIDDVNPTILGSQAQHHKAQHY